MQQLYIIHITKAHICLYLMIRYLCNFNRPIIMEIMNLKEFFTFIFLDINISVNIYSFDLKFSVYILKALPEESVSQFYFF